jgi:hypothetical protein
MAIKRIRVTIIIRNAIFTVRFIILKTTKATVAKIRKKDAATANPTGVDTIESGAISNKNILNFLVRASFQSESNLPLKVTKRYPESRILRQPTIQNQSIYNVPNKKDDARFQNIQLIFHKLDILLKA